jgi:hypothetical protein
MTTLLLIPAMSNQNAYATIMAGSVTGGDSGGEFEKIFDPIGPVGEDNFQSPNLIAFDERQNFVLTQPISLNNPIQILNIGDIVSSHYLLFDPEIQSRVTGCITFDSDVIGVIYSDQNQQDSDFLGNPSAQYPNSINRGIEQGDGVLITGNNEVCVGFTASTPGDAIRVITEFSPGAKEPTGKGGDNAWATRPTFAVSHEDFQTQIVENGFRFNTNEYTLTNNHHTDFPEEEVEIGTSNSFSATVYADKGLKVQEFLFGIPNVGEGHLAELGVEVWYKIDGEIEDVKVIQKSEVIDLSSISVVHQKVKCSQDDTETKCDNTTVSMKFLEPLKDKVMAIGAIDFDRRNQRTSLNEGFNISGESLNPMLSKMIPSSVRNEGAIQVTQNSKYSPYWTSEDGRLFEMNSFGSFKQINQSFERFQDTGSAFSRQHSAFEGILQYEENRAKNVFDSTKLISDQPNSFKYHIEIKDRIHDEVKQEMLLQEQIAKRILDEMDKQARHS